MQFKLKKYNKNISDEQLIADLKRVAKLLKSNTLKRRDYDKYGKYSSDVCRYRFGCWNAAVKIAGLKRTKVFSLSEAELLKNLLKVWIKLGRQPLCREMNDPEISEFSTHVYRRVFGSYRRALEKFVKTMAGKKVHEAPVVFLENKPAVKAKHKKRKRDVSHAMRYRVLTRDDYTCVKCGSSPATEKGVKLEIDHIKPYSKGGETVLSNLQTLCKKCNIGKGDK